VEPEARGRLRQTHVVTHATLDTAQHIYVKAGFHMLESPPAAHFGEPEPRCAWELSL
jgi:hypothetical protein